MCIVVPGSSGLRLVMEIRQAYIEIGKHTLCEIRKPGSAVDVLWDESRRKQATEKEIQTRKGSEWMQAQVTWIDNEGDDGRERQGD